MPDSTRMHGPWELLGEVGRGGMGVVHAARHSETGWLAAVKTTHPGGAAAALAREIAHLARLSHPGVVAVLDHGVADGVPWYAMEWLDGVRLDGVSAGPSTLRAPAPTAATWEEPELAATPIPADRAARIGPDRLREVARLARGVCEPLAWLHGEGVVHLDLKPGNILVRPDGRVVLVDFGLAASFETSGGREVLDAPGPRPGTPAYMAPELLRGGTVDARADLYALGCVLYQLLCGRPPFVGLGREVVDQHLHAPPKRPSDRAPGIPPDLDDLVLHLLAKRPEARVPYAVDVARALAPWSDESSDGPPPRPYVYRPRLLGREDDLRELDDVVSDGAALRLVLGESGIGKTRASAAVVRRAAAHGARVIVGECVERDGGPLHGLGGPLRALAQLGEEAGWGGPRAEVLAPYLGGRAGTAGAGEAERQRVVTAAVEVLARAAERRRLVLVVEDLQWADALTRDVLVHLARARIPGLAALATHRAEEGDPGPLLEAGAHALRLDRLSPVAAAALVRDMLALADPDAPLIRGIIAAAEGHPLFVVELVRWAVACGALVRPPGGPWRAVGDLPGRLPGTLAELVDRRLDALHPEALDAAMALAVLGREAPAAVLAHVVGAPIDAALDELGRAAVARVGPTGAARFTHDQLRAACYARIPPEARPSWHRRAAEALEGVTPRPHAAIARHREEAGELGAAGAAYALAAREAADRHAWQDAIVLGRAAVRLCEDPADRPALAADLADVLDLGATPTEARDAWLAALAGARASRRVDLAIRALHGLGHAELRGRDPARAAASFRASGRLSRLAGHARGFLRAEMGLAEARSFAARLDDADAHLRAVAERIGPADADLRVRVLTLRAGVATQRRRSEEAIAHLEHAVSLAASPLQRTTVDGHLAYVLFGVGRVAEARARAASAADEAREHGYLAREAFARSLLGLFAQLDGDDAAQEAETLRALALHRVSGAWNEELLNLANLGSLAGRDGRLREARGRFAEAEAILAGRHFPRGRAILVIQRATLERRAGADPAALRDAVADAARGLEARNDRPSAAMGWCEVVHLDRALDRDGSDALAEAERLAAAAGQHGGTLIGAALARARRALMGPHVRGEAPEDVPPAFRSV